MTRFRFLIAACAGTLLYVFMSLLGGRDGLWATSQLQEQKRQVSAHTASIQKTNDELQMENSALQSDPDVIAAYARKLGYVNEDEKLVKISGLAAKETQIFDPGTVIKHTPVKYIPEWCCKLFGLIVFAISYFILFMIDLKNGEIVIGNRKNRSVKGVPVYDMSKN
jgi:cell division protein FtsB